jgi:hypothetical protein
MLQLLFKQLTILQQEINKPVIYIGDAYGDMAVIVLKGVDDYRVHVINLLKKVDYFLIKKLQGVIGDLNYMRGRFVYIPPEGVWYYCTYLF